MWLSKEKSYFVWWDKVLNENYSEIKNILQNSFDDAVLIGDEKDFKKIKDLIENLNFSLGKINW